MSYRVTVHEKLTYGYAAPRADATFRAGVYLRKTKTKGNYIFDITLGS